MEAITVWGPVRMLPHRTPAWARQQGEKAKQLMTGQEGQNLSSWLLKPTVGHFPDVENLARLYNEWLVSSGDPRSWEGGDVTLRVGERATIRLGHLALIDLTDGVIQKIRPFD